MASKKKKRKKKARRSPAAVRRWPRRAGKRFTGSTNDPLYQRAFAAAMRAAGGGYKALPAPASTPPVITVYAEPSHSEGPSMPRPRRKKKVGRRYSGSVSNPLYRRALADAAKVLRRKKKKKRRGKKRPSPAQMRARKAFAARAKARSKASRKPKAASRRPSAGKKRRSASTRGLSAAAQVALRAARGLPTARASKQIGYQRWLCRGPRRSGCGSTGRVVSGTGKFRRLR